MQGKTAKIETKNSRSIYTRIYRDERHIEGRESDESDTTQRQHARALACRRPSSGAAGVSNRLSDESAQPAVMVQPKQPTALLYLRVSTKDQARRDGEPEGLSIPAQRTACQRKAAALGATVVGEFVDACASARSADRPALKQLLSRLQRESVSFVVVHKIDRLARNRADDVQITLAIRAAGATLVSCSENIDETPQGALLHGILSSFAEFLSRNLASEVMKGMTEKARRGGTPGKAPLGYRNTHTIRGGQLVKSVEIDPERGPLMRHAFTAYATGDYSITDLHAELGERGLTVARGQLHALLRHPYYKGVVRYNGHEYPGRHWPLVDERTWQHVQDLLATRNVAGERRRRHPHYLIGSLHCGRCRSRMIVTNARSHTGRVYPYFVCIGRQQKRTSCTLKAVLISKVEQAVLDEYDQHALTDDERQQTERIALDELTSYEHEQQHEQRRLTRERTKLIAERGKLLQAHYADAIPLDLLKVEQDRIRHRLTVIDERLDTHTANRATVTRNLKHSLALLADAPRLYETLTSSQRRTLNQALFTGLEVDDGSDVHGELAEPLSLAIEVAARAQGLNKTALVRLAGLLSNPPEPLRKAIGHHQAWKREAGRSGR